MANILDMLNQKMYGTKTPSFENFLLKNQGNMITLYYPSFVIHFFINRNLTTTFFIYRTYSIIYAMLVMH